MADSNTATAPPATLTLMNDAGQRREIPRPSRAGLIDELHEALRELRSQTADESWKPLAWHRSDAAKELLRARHALIDAVKDTERDDGRDALLARLRRAEQALKLALEHTQDL